MLATAHAEPYESSTASWSRIWGRSCCVLLRREASTTASPRSSGGCCMNPKRFTKTSLPSIKKSRLNRSTGPIDFSLLTDGLRAEREQGITIDVAYRYFCTPRRKFIIADTPGHEQYTRNMATGASTAESRRDPGRRNEGHCCRRRADTHTSLPCWEYQMCSWRSTRWTLSESGKRFS